MELFVEVHLLKWWERRSDEQRARLKQAANTELLGSDTVDLLFNTACPYGPVAGKWVIAHDWDCRWPEDVRAFIKAQ